MRYQLKNSPRFREYLKRSYNECKAKNICVTCRYRATGFKATLNEHGDIKDKKRMVRCYTCVVNARRYQFNLKG